MAYFFFYTRYGYTLIVLYHLLTSVVLTLISILYCWQPVLLSWWPTLINFIYVICRLKSWSHSEHVMFAFLIVMDVVVFHRCKWFQLQIEAFLFVFLLYYQNSWTLKLAYVWNYVSYSRQTSGKRNLHFSLSHKALVITYIRLGLFFSMYSFCPDK